MAKRTENKCAELTAQPVSNRVILSIFCRFSAVRRAPMIIIVSCGENVLFYVILYLEFNEI